MPADIVPVNKMKIRIYLSCFTVLPERMAGNFEQF